ncbi:MAG: aquaporin [Anaerolineae bacterium]
MPNDLVKASLAELIGTFILVFVGGFAVTIAPQFGVLVPALAHGIILVGIIYTYGHISGAHVNPAVTVGLLVGGKVDAVRAGAYIVAQFIGGIIAAVLITVIVTSTAAPFNFGQTTGSLTEGNVWNAALFEAVLTFFLVSTVYQAAVYGKAGNLAPVAIGFTLTGSILAGGVYTGASLNPARTFGPALTAGNFDYVIPYFIGIFAGGIIAGLLHATFFAQPDLSAPEPDYPLTEADQR